jgi:hypothetical protein
MQASRKKVSSFINRDSNSPAKVGIMRLARNIIYRELKKETTTGLKGPSVATATTDFKRGSIAHLNQAEVDLIDLNSSMVADLMDEYNKVFDFLGFIVNAGKGVEGHAPPQLGPRTLLLGSASDPRFEVPARYFPRVLANDGDEEDDDGDERHKQADPTPSPTAPGALKKTGTYKPPPL